MPQTESPRPQGDMDRTTAWTAYWASGALHSCATSFSGNYAGQLEAFWHQLFSQLPEAACVADLCCGNAPLSKLLLESPHAARVARIDAVDVADIAPPWVTTSDEATRLHIHPRVDVTSLPFAPATFDLCMSQYGLEYAGAAAFHEVTRVLRPGGRLAAVLHHAESLPVRIAKAECAHLHWLLSASDLYACAAAMIAPMARTGTEQGRAELMRDPTANATRAAFNQALQALNTRIQTEPSPAVLVEQRQWLMKLLGEVPRIGIEPARNALDSVLAATRASLLRQQELVQYACDEAQVRGLAACLGDPAPVVSELCFDTGDVAGFGLVAVRGAGHSP